MTANAATPQPLSLASHAARSVADAGTPFYNHLMAMIDATARENRSAAQSQQTAAVPLLVGPSVQEIKWPEWASGWSVAGWPVAHLLTYAAGAVAAVAVVGAVVGAVGRLGAPAVVADSTTGRTALAVASAVAVDKPDGLPEAKTIPAPQVKVSAPPETEGVRTVSVRTVPVAAKTGTDAKTGADAKAEVAEAADAPVPTKAPEAVSKAPVKAPADTWPAAEVAAPPSPPTEDEKIETGSIETGSTIKASAGRPGRIVSDVRLRAGPGNSEAVLGTLARGTAVQVIGCRAWCEVIADGQRGWIYKGFLDAPEASAKR